MSAVIVKGIIISLSLAAAVGIALQSPEVKEWLEEQRRKLAELLRNVSEGLDPQTRREAEAFAYEGRMPTAHEREGMVNATAVATGRENDDSITSRRMNRQSSSNPIDAEERRRLGREYLARRNQELLDMKKKRESEQMATLEPESMETGITNEKETLAIREKSNSVGSFDHLINEDGSLRLDEKRVPDGVLPVPEIATFNSSPQPVLAPVAVRALEAGTAFGNPFADEFAMSDTTFDRSATPKPPVPPKIAFGTQTPTAPADRNAANVEDPPEQAPMASSVEFAQNLSFDEQLARALSISLAESERDAQKAVSRNVFEQGDFERAIQESLKDYNATQQTQNYNPPDSISSPTGPLVDISSDAGPSKPSTTNPYRQRTEDDELYYLTPAPTGVKGGKATADVPDELPDMAKFLSALQTTSATPQQSNKYDFPDVPTGALKSPFGSPIAAPVQETLSPFAGATQPISPRSATLSPSLPAQDALSTGYHTESDADDFASLPDSTAHSEASLVEVEDVDIESMSDDDDGIHTPTSWSEVGSDVGDSERSESEAGDLVHV